MNKELLTLKKESQKIIKEKNKKSITLSHTRLFLFIVLFIVLFISLSTTNYIGLSISLLLGITFIIVIIIHEKLLKEINKHEFIINTISRYENRTNNKWKEEQSENIDNLPNFVNDLDIINGNSLFKYLNFTKSLGSKNKLINSLILKDKLTKKEIMSKQESIKEISSNPKLIIESEYLLNKIDKIEENDYKEYFSFFTNKRDLNKIELIISIIISCITTIIGILTLFNITPLISLIVLIIIQLIHSYIVNLRYNEQLELINKYSRIYSNLKEIYEYISKQEFSSKKNNNIKDSITKGTTILNRINKLNDLNSLRYNFITNFIFNIFMSLNIIVINKYNKIFKENISIFKESIKSLEEYEVLLSLSTIPLVKKDISLPSITNELELTTNNIKHPLLKENTCIDNSFSCQKDINIITGSNMSGKTSFMKTIATNLILAYNGTYVNSLEFTCPIANLFTSINVKDDISKGISTFYGELKRIKDILDYSKQNNDKLIIFIDEIFKGTNYNDRILGAKEVLKQLSKLNCIVFLTTHDFELCEVNQKEIKNYHFSENYKNKKINFDYKIKEGKCNTTNAQYLMKQMGIIK